MYIYIYVHIHDVLWTMGLHSQLQLILPSCEASAAGQRRPGRVGERVLREALKQSQKTSAFVSPSNSDSKSCNAN